MNSILYRIFNEAWMISPDHANSYLPFVMKLIEGQNVQLGKKMENQVYAYNSRALLFKKNSDLVTAPTGSVAVFHVLGAVTKYDQLCSDGMMTLESQMIEADQLDNIAGHILKIDSPGGEAAYMDTIARTIREQIKKPVIAFVNGLAASAAFYLAAACDRIYANEKNDQVGSIGVLVSFMDFRPYYEKQGVRVHEIYASQSSKKNDEFREALKGNYEPLQESILNPYAEQFIDAVKYFRPGLTDPAAYKGKLFRAEEAVSIGMIDGIQSFKACVKEIKEMSGERQIKPSGRPSAGSLAPGAGPAKKEIAAIEGPQLQYVLQEANRDELMKEIKAMREENKAIINALRSLGGTLTGELEESAKMRARISNYLNLPGDEETRSFAPGDPFSFLDISKSESPDF
jgi:protease-4